MDSSPPSTFNATAGNPSGYVWQHRVSEGNTSNNSGALLSLRLSCDRCRAQKLKCNVPAGSSVCARCAKAKAPCCFGRRTQSKRRTRAPSKCQVQHASPPSTADSTDSISAPPSPPLSYSCSTQASNSFVGAGSLDFAMTNHGQPDFDANVYDAQASWTTYNNGLPTPDTLDWTLSMTNFDWTSYQKFSTDDSNTFTFDQPEFAQSCAPSVPATHNFFALDQTPVAPEIEKFPAAKDLATHQLTSLIARIQTQLSDLDKGRWQAHQNSSCLDLYPVGNILSLSREYTTVAAMVLAAAKSAGSAMDKFDESSSMEQVDTPALLLVLCGYLWLVRIFDVVLGHFQERLYTSSGQCDAHRSVCMSELQWSDSARDLHQIFTAVQMLLDVLQNIEQVLGVGSIAARDMAVMSLLNSARQQEGISHGLNAKALVVKDLLRQKFGF